ncbi:biotin--[acetyl-CoA-carboxylase] ligase [Mucilaginibacter sp. HMF7410]|uniref:Biotin--[acetyl-CoA-carboxylase] ligase n=2 Tax=Mucilaginibacter arboris TaxID=2682090 RepID=A0A7K1ST10_9SPHI|nr:biotin--[acetyl-CoA-carboxylase] ligase [Mucilaginibacter arboris]
MKQLMANSTPLPEGTVIMAEQQTAGKGQQQNGWHSEAGKNLTFSLLLLPGFLMLANSFDLLTAISLGVIKPLQKILGKDTCIKWPNDIYYGQKKLGGILIENVLAGKNIKHSIIGIGININQENFPGHLPNPVSVKQILQKECSLKEVLLQICAGIEFYYLKLKAGKSEEIKQEYLDNLYGFRKTLQFKANNEVFEGEIFAVNHFGFLGVKKQKETVFYDLKQIKFIFS